MWRSGAQSKSSERLTVDKDQVLWLSRLIRHGESQHLEFKAKTNFPEKIVHELIAFANTEGGTLLIGISDDGKISGVKYPEEDELLIRKASHKHCWPRIKTKSYIIKVSEKKWVVVFEVSESKRKPVQFKLSRSKQVTYIRYQDKTIQASIEAQGILRMKFGKAAIGFNYGDVENKILKALHLHGQANLTKLKLHTGLEQNLLSQKLVQLAATNVIGWKPLDGTDIFYSQ